MFNRVFTHSGPLSAGRGNVQESVTLCDIVLPYLEMSDRGRGGTLRGSMQVCKNAKVENSSHFEVRFS